MKIWKAELVLFYTENDTYDIKFSLTLQEQEFEFNERTSDEWIHAKEWVVDRIPKKMNIERYYDNYKITQGFDHELNEEELKQLEKTMRECMQKQLDCDKELYLKKYEQKLKVIQL